MLFFGPFSEFIWFWLKNSIPNLYSSVTWTSLLVLTPNKTQGSLIGIFGKTSSVHTRQILVYISQRLKYYIFSIRCQNVTPLLQTSCLRAWYICTGIFLQLTIIYAVWKRCVHVCDIWLIRFGLISYKFKSFVVALGAFHKLRLHLGWVGGQKNM